MAPHHPLMDFPPDEYVTRQVNLAAGLQRADLDGVVVLTEHNHRYLSGHWGERWPSFPAASLYTSDGRAVLVCSEVERGQVQATSWIDDIRIFEWGENNELGRAAARLIADACNGLGMENSRIGLETTGPSRICLSVEDVMHLRYSLPNVRWQDATRLLASLRMTKTAREVDALEHAADIVERARELSYESLRPGMTERSLYQTMVANMFRCGSQQLGYVLVKHLDGTFGYSDRPYNLRDVVHIDGGTVYKGYRADRQRLAAFGGGAREHLEAYARLMDLLGEMLSEVRPGVGAASFTRSYLRSFQKVCRTLPGAKSLPRWCGHGIGLEETEEPSLSLDSEAVFERGMTIMIEPIIFWNDCWYTTEECVFVTDTAFELIGAATPPELPVVPAKLTEAAFPQSETR